MSTHIRNVSPVNVTARRIVGFLSTAAAILAISGLCLLPTGCSDGTESVAEGKRLLDKENYEAATRLFRKAAACENTEAMYYFGKCHYEGRGVDQDTDVALQWWHKAADRGSAEAMFAIAQCYFLEHGVSKDFSEALKWIRSAADTGDPDAQFGLGDILLCGILSFDYKDIRVEIDTADRDKSGSSVFVERDLAFAAKMFRAAAKRGHVNSMLRLALCYHNGLGMPKNEAEMEKWLARAAEAGGVSVMLFISDAYLGEKYIRSYDGSGIVRRYRFCPKSDEKATEWYLKAVQAGAELTGEQMLCVADFYYGNKTQKKPQRGTRELKKQEQDSLGRKCSISLTFITRTTTQEKPRRGT